MLDRLKIEEGWFTLFLVWALVMTTASAILNAELIAGLELMPLIATSAVLTGLILSKSRFSGRSAHLAAIIYGLFLIIFLIGRDLPDDLSWRERVFDLVSRQITWISKAASQGSSRDGLIFVMHTGIVFWLLGYTAAWYTFRKPRLWRVLIPSALVLLSIIYYYYGPKPLAGYLALYTLLALIYIARTHLGAQERKWRENTVRYDSGLRFNFLQASILAALVVLGISWGLPSASANSAVSNALGQSEISQTWRDFQDNWTRLFSSLRTYGTGTSDAFRSNLSLGGPRSVSSTLVMDVYVDEPLPYVYWKAVSYDTYEDGTWSISQRDSYNYLPDEGEIPIENSRMRKEVSQTFVNYVPNAGMIYAAPELIKADRPMVVNHSLDDTGNMVVNSAMSRLVLRQGERYRVNSDYSIADASSLRLAPEEYPRWIRERYLQVPESITPETIALAEQLTAEADDPFDKAIAVRDYLRKNIVYNDQIQAPPDGIEPIHYILFNEQEAYCNYYASSMVMMLRSQGVPARFVAGYTQGEWDEETSSYRVRARNSHAWVEVYFPGYGWIQFEPTASLPLGQRPESSGNPGDAFESQASLEDEQALIDELAEDLSPQEQQGQSEAAQSGQGDSSNRAWLLRTIIAVFITGLGLLTILAGKELNWRVESDIIRSYGRLGSWARWLGIVIRPAHTPHERAGLLTKEVPEGRQSFYSLTDQYVRQRFSRKGSAIDGYDSASEWHLVRPFLIRKTIYNQFKKVFRRPRRR